MRSFHILLVVMAIVTALSVDALLLDAPTAVTRPSNTIKPHVSTIHSPIMDHQFLLSQELPSPRTQAQQMSDAMVLKTLQGTKWRLFVDLPSQQQRQQSLTLVFQGFDSQPNKGIVQLSNGRNTMTTTGRWLSKPSEIRRGAVQLSARWKLKLPTTEDLSDNGSSSSQYYIFKGFIRAAPTLATGGYTVEAQMTGTILSAETEGTVGKFRADLIAVDIPDDELKL